MAYIEFNDVVKEYPAGSSSIRAVSYTHLTLPTNSLV